MFRHVVCQKFANKEDAVEAAGMLRGLLGVVPTLRSIEVGVNELTSERSFDLVAIATFDDIAGLHAYDEHPAHLACRGFIKPRRIGTVSVDYTI